MERKRRKVDAWGVRMGWNEMSWTRGGLQLQGFQRASIAGEKGQPATSFARLQLPIRRKRSPGNLVPTTITLSPRPPVLTLISDSREDRNPVRFAGAGPTADVELVCPFRSEAKNLR